MKQTGLTNFQRQTVSHASRLMAVLGTLLATTASSVGAEMDKPLLVVSGDFDGDNLSDKVQGFPEASAGAGRVDVFWGAARFRVAWPTVLSAIKNPSTRLISGRLGEALAVGDFNGDGLDDLAIGAPHANSTDTVVRTHSGSVVVIYGCGAPACQSVQSSGAGSLAAGATGSSLDPRIAAGALRITPLVDVAFGRFGKSLAAGDFDDDGYDDLAIGAPGDKVGAAMGAGSITVIQGGSGGLDLGNRRLLHQDLLPAGASPAEADDHFGNALGAARLDLDDDDDLVVGVPDEDYGSEVNAGEVNVFWGGGSGLRGSSYVAFRHSIAMAGADRSGDRLGYNLRAFDRTVGLLDKQIPGRVSIGLAEASACNGTGGFLSVHNIGAAPLASLGCEVDISSAESAPGDGALSEIPVNFIVIANPATVGGGASNLNKLPDADWGGFDPLTGGAISGAAYFEAQIDLLNQQVRADDGNPVCKGNDCLRFDYRRHTYYNPSMFQEGNRYACPKLHAIANPSGNLISESPLEITEDGDPSGPVAGRYTSFSDLAEAAVDECALLTDDDALNVIIYDVCGRAPGPDGSSGTTDDILDCSIEYNGRGRTNGTRPYMFVDYARALLPRNPTTTFPRAAEEHEAGHVFGLSHACDLKDPADPADPDSWTRPNGTHLMQGGDCVGPIPRNLGFATQTRMDDGKRWVVEVDTMIQTARELARTWRSSPAAPPLKPQVEPPLKPPVEPKLTASRPRSTR